MLQARWDEKLAEIETLPDFVRTEASANADSYNRNFTKWNTLGRKVYNETDEAAALKTHSEHAAYLANWLNQRITWLNDYYHSDAFTKGVFLDESDQEIDVKNVVIASALMFWGGSGTIPIAPDLPQRQAPDGGADRLFPQESCSKKVKRTGFPLIIPHRQLQASIIAFKPIMTATHHI